MRHPFLMDSSEAGTNFVTEPLRRPPGDDEQRLRTPQTLADALRAGRRGFPSDFGSKELRGAIWAPGGTGHESICSLITGSLMDASAANKKALLKISDKVASPSNGSKTPFCVWPDWERHTGTDRWEA
ncbi:MAG: hypothetical protein N2C14_24075 [Planctomycetales bacterium]